MIFSKLILSQSRRYIHTCIDVSSEVKNALALNKAVVALESTIITHGMPYPHNKTTAEIVEKIVREQGAVPATIGIINGRIKVGMDAQMLETLSHPETNKVKVSRRDFPYVLSQKLNGGTTVSGTLLVANKIGVEVFVTGGIGGVHRDVNNTMDISADLIELSRSPVLVVSSGVKSILDIGRTLEYLETLGVCVVTYDKTREFPAFYTSKSGYQSIYNVSDAESAAKLIYHVKKLGSLSGILLGVPIPEELSFNDKKMQIAIEEALGKAQECGITGKRVTPFVLEHICKITNGKSLESNIALIKNNALVGAQIAVQLKVHERNHLTIIKNVECNERTSLHPNIVVIGGSMMDMVVRSDEDIQNDGRTVNGCLSWMVGGVGRNIADAAAKLQPHNPPVFVSVVGDDDIGTMLMESVKHANIEGVRRLQNENSACAVVMLDERRDCSFIVADMHIHQLIKPQQVLEHESVIRKSSLVVFDSNLPIETMKTIVELCDKHNIAMWFEPTDLTIASKPFEISTKTRIEYISPNLAELKRIAEFVTGKPSMKKKLTDDGKMVTEARDLCLQILNRVPNIIVTLGRYGQLIAKENLSGHRRITFYPATVGEPSIESVSGAGDCFASGFMVAMLQGYEERHCVSFGVSAALQSLSAKQTVPGTLRYQQFEQDTRCVELPLTGPVHL